MHYDLGCRNHPYHAAGVDGWRDTRLGCEFPPPAPATGRASGYSTATPSGGACRLRRPGPPTFLDDVLFLMEVVAD
jgi:hypothetical protein